MELLLTVEDHFLIKGRGLVVMPDLAPPQDLNCFKTFTDLVLINLPDGTEIQQRIIFVIEHLSNCDTGLHKCVIRPMLPDGTKEMVPIGSKLFVSDKVIRKLGRKKSK